MSILKLLAALESRTLEFKERMPSALAIAKTICAFSNGAGGSIIIGIRDRDKTLIGIEELEVPDVEEQVANITYDKVEPIPPFSITLEDLGKGVSEHRNKIIGRTFSELGLIEGFGTGVFRMRKYCREWGIADPEFREDSGFFKTILYKKLMGEEKQTGHGLIELGEDEKKVLTYIEEKGKGSTKELESIINKSKSTVKRKMKKLVEKKYLIWQGKSLRDPVRHYELRKEEISE
jgi:predicted HTH transcriptional regulator